MSDIDPLLLDFAQASPESFARTLALGDSGAADTLLAELPLEEGAAIVCRLPAARIASLLGQDAERSKGWLTASTFEDAVALLAQVSRDRRFVLVNALEDRKRRRRLLQFLNYPAHSVGALVDEPLALLTENTPIVDVLVELRKVEGELERPVIVVDQAGRYRGVLDVWQLATRERLEGTVKDYLEAVVALRPETNTSEACRLPQWADRNWLPVTDHEAHVVGWVSRASVFARSEQGESSLYVARESLLDVISQMVRVMSDLLARLLAPWNIR